ncbi:hypothetical protein HBB16_20460 [Pseudonocardia sp. MCCB 268]|nr:hypothetical protein [Pseudonocardia cytotoxica]
MTELSMARRRKVRLPVPNLVREWTRARRRRGHDGAGYQTTMIEDPTGWSPTPTRIAGAGSRYY